MPINIQQVIQELVKSEYLHETHRRQGGKAPVVTLSRDLGAGGFELATRLARALEVEIWDRQILDAIAKAANSDPELMSRLDDRVKTGKSTWIYNLLSGQNAFMVSYRHHLVNVALALAQRGGVIIGRGAHLILADRPAFRLRVVGSLDACTRRVAARELLDYDAAMAQVKKVNQEREDFLWNAFGHHLDESDRFDLIVNTDKFDGEWEDLTRLVLTAMELGGFGGKSHRGS